MKLLAVITGAFVLGSSSTLGANPSDSKLSVQIYFQYTPGAQQIINGHPRVLKILKTDTAMMDAARDFKSSTPGGKVIVRHAAESAALHAYRRPRRGGEHLVDRVHDSRPARTGNADHALIDYVEGPNEDDNCPTFSDPDRSGLVQPVLAGADAADSGLRLHALPGQHRRRQPAGRHQQHQQHHRRVRARPAAGPRLSAARWGYHAYTYFYGYDPNGVELNYSLRYRQFYSLFAQIVPRPERHAHDPHRGRRRGRRRRVEGPRRPGHLHQLADLVRPATPAGSVHPRASRCSRSATPVPGAPTTWRMSPPGSPPICRIRSSRRQRPYAVDRHQRPEPGAGAVARRIRLDELQRQAIDHQRRALHHHRQPDHNQLHRHRATNGITYYYIVSGLTSAGESPNSIAGQRDPG